MRYTRNVWRRPENSRLFWLTVGSQANEILYTVGHCETISESANSTSRIAIPAIRDLGFEVGSIGDLTELNQRDADGVVLIVGNAWSSFDDAEIQAAGRFVAEGGQILLVGLEWSWNDYRRNDGFNPCSFNPYSSAQEKEVERYPWRCR